MSRNGYRGRDWQTRVGSVEPRIPRLRPGSCLPSFPRAAALGWEGPDGVRPCLSDQWHCNGSLQEAHVHGVSTRSVDDLVQARGGTGISQSQVSRRREEIDKRVGEFLIRPTEGEQPYLWIDATCLKVRQGGRIASVAVTVAVSVNADGRRAVPGMAIGASEAEPFWTELSP